ncbi:MAG TPA: hypothetical protein VFG46_08570 [Chryseolinea sp.]|nr:hypothetical protein [Chryseolinea sp.]
MKYLAPDVLLFALIILLTNSTFQMETTTTNTKIARIWRGSTSVQDAKKLEQILREEAIPSIEKNKSNGLKGIALLTLQKENEVVFTTIMYFDSIESVIAFAGDDYSKAHIDPAVKPLLTRYDKVVEHHTIRESRTW